MNVIPHCHLKQLEVQDNLIAPKVKHDLVECAKKKGGLQIYV